MKYLIVLMFSFSALGQVSQQNVSEMLNQMVRENVISAVEAEKAKFKMNNMHEDEWAAINKQAAAAAARSPASVTPSGNKIEEIHKIDLEGEQFKQIQQDIKKIIPDHKE